MDIKKFLTDKQYEGWMELEKLTPTDPAMRRDVFGQDVFDIAQRAARVLTEMANIGGRALVLTLAKPYVEKGIISVERCGDLFSPGVGQMLADLQKAGSLIITEKNLADKEFSSFMVSFVRDIRIIISMIAECYARMTAVSDRPADKYSLQLARAGKEFCAPIAHKLGLYEIKRELEDLAVKFQDPEAYARIQHSLNQTRQQRDEYLQKVVDTLRQRITGIGFEYTVKYRTKSIHSIYAKMVKKGIDLDGIYDLYALRIIVDTTPELEKAACWAMFGLTTSVFLPNLLRTRDWITKPRESGYESLHTTVLGPDNHWVEVQIRSQRMDEDAECGIAAHWRYKGEAGHDETLNNVLTDIRNAMEKQTSLEDMEAHFAQELYPEEVFVFDNSDKLHKVSTDTRVIDYIIQIAPEADWVELFSGAKVNGVERPLDHVLHNGDRVELIIKM
ncbi:MAG: bifunctional (p)ppGpp synthetase/guanosine-3',5'-bis(diphosphate) 3'-pyrophosphohydrolase [Bacteroidaceae bacterium]|nr:bifunctional (p)ppGpp synthetase/guanosine-3',5'-bis(diphosphate) 3'-pyrophosphohydrolase [Bacteroidaceae bacterium]